MHSIYKQSALPYFTKKPCPKCNKILSFDVLICPDCKYNFSSMNFEGPKTKVIDIGALNVQGNASAANENAAVQPANDQPTTVIPTPAASNPYPQQSYQQPVYTQQPVYQQPVYTQPNRVMYCDNCHSIIPGNARFCSVCGAINTKKFCAGCGQMISSSMQVCPYCGARQTIVEMSNNQNQNATTVIPTFPATGYVNNQGIPQPINIYVTQPNGAETTAFSLPNQNQNNIPEEHPEVFEGSLDNMSNKPKEEEKEEVHSPSEAINMGRKRFFLVLQLIFALLIAAVAVLFPLVMKDKFLSSAFIEGFSGKLLSDSFISGYKVFGYGIEIVKNIIAGNMSGIMDVIKNDELHNAVMNSETGKYIVACVPGISNFIEWIAGKAGISGDTLACCVSLVFVGLFYLILFIGLTVTLFSSIIGMFVKRPHKVKAFAFISVTTLIGSVLFFTAKWTPFNNGTYGYCDSFTIYAFALSFLFWFVCKLVFLRENKTYVAYLKEARKNKE